MPILRNTRHEMFAQFLAQGKSATGAYVQAGYKDSESARFRASRLRTNGNVQKRIDELKQKVAKKMEITQESLIAEAEEIRELAIRDKQYNAALGAVKEKGILSGKRVERTEAGEPGDFDTMNDLEAAQAIKKQREELDKLHKVAEGLARASRMSGRRS
jgi:phage terminase small subunit